MAYKKVFTTFGPLMVDETTKALLVMLAGGADLAALIKTINPPVTTPPAAASAHTGDGWVEDFTIPANCVYAEVVFNKKAYAMAGMTTINPANNGAPYMPNIRVPIMCGGTYNRIFVKNGDAGQNVTAECTFYCTE